MNDLKIKFGNINNEENEEENNEKNSDELDLEEKNNTKNDKNDKNESIENKNSKKKKQSQILEQRIKNKKIISDYLCKINTILIFKFLSIFVFSFSYYIASIISIKSLKIDYLKFDSNLEIINKLYLDYYNISIIFQKKIENLERERNISDFEILEESSIVRPNFGNSLVFFQSRTKYSKKNLEIFNELYSGNACKILEKNVSDNKICEILFSSVLNNGLDQTISQINNIIISNTISELNSLKQNRTLSDIFEKNTAFSDFEIFMAYYILLAYLKTEIIFKEFRNDEEIYMHKVNNYVLIVFIIIYIILFIFLLIYIYSYKDFTGYFLCFIGIIPPKYMADDDEFYKQVIGLDPFYY
jgi:hypothetical protein